MKWLSFLRAALPVAIPVALAAAIYLLVGMLERSAYEAGHRAATTKGDLALVTLKNEHQEQSWLAPELPKQVPKPPQNACRKSRPATTSSPQTWPSSNAKTAKQPTTSQGRLPVSPTSTGRRSTRRLSLCLLACSLLAGCGFMTKQPAPEPLCPAPQIPAELLRKSPTAKPLSNSIQASARPLSWDTTSSTPSSAATQRRSWTL